MASSPRQRAPPLLCCRTSLPLPRSLVAQRAPSPTCAASCMLQQHAVMPAGGLLFLRSPVVVVVHPGETPRVLRGEEGKPLDAHRCSERCTNRNHHRPYKHRLGLFMDREMMIEPVMWCQPQDAVGGRPEGWT
uniref:Uncharacterized protein n=1 Tax=Zea mays TaxID=4577 RepID=A0A804NXD1_MAIZE